MPPKWTPPRDKSPPQLKEDAGTYYRDVNAAYTPGGPLDPAVEAIMQSDQDIGNVSIFACGSTLGNLLRFSSGESKAFRMIVTVVGGVVHLVRRERSPTEIIKDVRGYGHSFPEAYTTWDQSVKGSASHQRTISYTFASMKMLVRSEGDGYLPDQDRTRPSIKTTEDASIEELAAAFEGTHKTSYVSGPSTIQITNAGSIVPQQALFDLKTRSIRRKHEEHDIIAEQMPRLWIRQIPNLILAYHNRGCFTDIAVKDIRSEVATWQTDNQALLRRFAYLLHRIDRAVKCVKDAKLEVTCEEDGSTDLHLRDMMPDAPVAFSAPTEARWRAWLTDKRTQPVESDLIVGKREQASHGGGTSLPDAVEKEKLRLGFDGRVRGGKLDFTACDDECGYCGLCEY